MPMWDSLLLSRKLSSSGNAVKPRRSLRHSSNKGSWLQIGMPQTFGLDSKKTGKEQSWNEVDVALTPRVLVTVLEPWLSNQEQPQNERQ